MPTFVTTVKQCHVVIRQQYQSVLYGSSPDPLGQIDLQWKVSVIDCAQRNGIVKEDSSENPAPRIGINWHSNLLSSLNPVPINHRFFYFDPLEDVEVVSSYRDQQLQVG